MDSFCHKLDSPVGSRLHVRKADNFVNFVLFLPKHQQCLSAEVDSTKHSAVSQLLLPCGKLKAFIHNRELTLQNDGEDLLRGLSLDLMNPIEALRELLDAHSDQSQLFAELRSKKRDLSDVNKEACELLVRIEAQRKAEFARFILILNEKKRKIRELKVQLGEGEAEEAIDDFGLKAEVEKMSQDSESQQKGSENSSSQNVQRKQLKFEQKEDNEVDEVKEKKAEGGKVEVDSDKSDSDFWNEYTSGDEDAQSTRVRRSDSEDHADSMSEATSSPEKKARIEVMDSNADRPSTSGRKPVDDSDNDEGENVNEMDSWKTQTRITAIRSGPKKRSDPCLDRLGDLL